MPCFYFSHSERQGGDERKKKNRHCRFFQRNVSLSYQGEEARRLSGVDVPSQTLSEPAMEKSSFDSSSQQQQKKKNRLQAFTYAELRVATRGFHRTNLLGEGGFGCVYKGFIAIEKPPGQVGGEGAAAMTPVKTSVAVKQLNTQGQQGHKEWLAEVHFLGVVEHPNLVKLLGYCAVDDDEGLKRLLVYEFMPNKGLDYHLFRGRQMIPWNLRLHVALGAGQGLAYLHEENDFQIIFRDFKSSNILLDNNFNPKLSDFGLAREGPEPGFSHVSTGVVGTVGYAAPEYIRTGHLTSKSDVWSFGVVLLELLTGRKAVDRNLPKNEQHLTDWAKPFIQDNKKLPSIVDPKLEGHYSLTQVQLIALLAGQCLLKQAKSRPTMGEVVKQLKLIVETAGSSPPRPLSLSAISPPQSSGKKKKSLEKGLDNREDLRGGIWRMFRPKLVKA